MKMLIKIWMYTCTVVCTVFFLAVIGLYLWATCYPTDKETNSTFPREANSWWPHLQDDPEIIELLEAVESKDFEVIYRYAAPELKEKISYDLFVQDQSPNYSTKNITVYYTGRSRNIASDGEHILVILSFENNGALRWGSMRWERTKDSIHYDTLPFPVTLLSEFSDFPTHITD